MSKKEKLANLNFRTHASRFLSQADAVNEEAEVTEASPAPENPATEQVVESVAAPIVEAQPEKVAEETPEVVTEPVTKEGTEQVAEGVTKEVTKKQPRKSLKMQPGCGMDPDSCGFADNDDWWMENRKAEKVVRSFRVKADILKRLEATAKDGGYSVNELVSHVLERFCRDVSRRKAG